MLGQALAYGVTFTDISPGPRDSIWIVTDQDVDTGPGGLRPLQQGSQIRAGSSHEVPGPIHDLGGEKAAGGSIGQEPPDGTCLCS
jgi:hypothetical protein